MKVRSGHSGVSGIRVRRREAIDALCTCGNQVLKAHSHEHTSFDSQANLIWIIASLNVSPYADCKGLCLVEDPTAMSRMRQGRRLWDLARGRHSRSTWNEFWRFFGRREEWMVSKEAGSVSVSRKRWKMFTLA